MDTTVDERIRISSNQPVRRAAAPKRARKGMVALAALHVALLCAPASLGSGGQIGEPAPDFALRSLPAGAAERLSEHVGEVVVLNFWASWCSACREEMPFLEAMHDEHRRAGLAIFGVSIDEDPARAAAMARTLQLSYTLLADRLQEAAKAYRIRTIPTTVIIDRGGVVRYLAEGYKPGYERRHAEVLRELLNE